MTICSKPEQDQTGQNFSTDCGLVPETPPLAEELAATGEGESILFSGEVIDWLSIFPVDGPTPMHV